MGYYPGQAHRRVAPRTYAEIAKEGEKKEGRRENNKIYLQGAIVDFHCSELWVSFQSYDSAGGRKWNKSC
jgi:hypothetical protein